MLKKLRIPIAIVGLILLAGSVFVSGDIEGRLSAFSLKGVLIGAILFVLGMSQILKVHLEKKAALLQGMSENDRPAVHKALITLQIIAITTPIWGFFLLIPAMGFAAIALPMFLAVFVAGPSLVGMIITAFLPDSLTEKERILSWIGITLIFSFIAYLILNSYRSDDYEGSLLLLPTLLLK